MGDVIEGGGGPMSAQHVKIRECDPNQIGEVVKFNLVLWGLRATPGAMTPKHLPLTPTVDCHSPRTALTGNSHRMGWHQWSIYAD